MRAHHEEPTGGIRAFVQWSRNVATIAAGLATVGLVAWWLAKAVLVSRDEYTAHRTEITRLAEQVSTMQKALADQNDALREIGMTLSEIRVKLATVGRP